MAASKSSKRKVSSTAGAGPAKKPKTVGSHYDGPAATPEKAGVDPAPLKGYEDTMVKMIKQGGLAGCASMVVRNGVTVQANAWGHADLESGTPFRMDTICRMVCATKSYLAVAFFSLVEEGKASPEDRVDKYIPGFAKTLVRVKGKEKLVEQKRPMLIKHLLSHTAGIGYSPELGDEPEDPETAAYLELQQKAAGGKITSLRAFVDGIAKIPLQCQPGYCYNYSFSFDVLGRVLEVITGKTFEAVLEERVFKPMGMKDTKWAVPEKDLGRLAALYGGKKTWTKLYGKDGRKQIRPRTGLYRLDGNTTKASHWRKGQECKVKSGGGFLGYDWGGMVSTVADTFNWVKMFLNYGVMHNGKRLLSKKSILEMEKNRLNAATSGEDKVCYAGNINVFRPGGDEYGMGGAACTYWNVDRDDQTGAVWFTQNVDMPEYEDLKGVDPKLADMWQALHKAVTMGSKGKSAKGRTSKAKKQK